MVFLFGNSLRCVSQEHKLDCPELCTAKVVKCDRNLDPNCTDTYRCAAPDLEQSLIILRQKLNQLETQLTK